MDQAHDARDAILNSWDANARAWADSVRGARIESRRVATDAAILDAVCGLAPARVLDVGCGEGWLTRALGARGIEATGVDGCAALIEAATACGGGSFQVRDYAAIAAAPCALGRFDAAVCNFALFEQDLSPLLAALHALLDVPGTLLIQSVHPDARPDGGREDGWRVETFAPLGESYTAPMPWYFRTLESWRRTLADAGFDAVHDTHVQHPASGAPLSLILQATRNR